MLIVKSERRSVIWSRGAILLFVLLLSSPLIYSQSDKGALVPFKVRKGSYVFMRDSLYYFNYDTVLYLSNSLLPDNPDVVEKTKIFYDSLKTKAYRSGLTKRLYDLVIVLPPGESNQDYQTSINTDNDENEGKIIRKISFTRLNPFGTNINSPDKNAAEGFSDFLNKTHATTREFVLRNYLFFKEGDRLNPFQLAESERIIRRLKYIDDVRIIVIPVSDELVDIILITRDVYSLGLYYEIRGIKSGTVDLFERSLFGLGHEFVLTFPYDYYKDYYGFGYGLSYKMKNISRSYIDASISYSNALGREYYDFNVQREFVTATTKYAAGFNIRETFTSNDLDTLESRAGVEYNNLDVWAGRSFMIDSSNLTRLVIAARHINNNVYERPEISSNSFYSLQKYKLYLASISLVNQKYFKTNLIYNYGRTEDIPYGGKLQITYGKEFNEFSRRDYFEIEATVANFPSRFGYVNTSGKIGLFSRDFLTEQGALDVRLNYISNLTSWGKYRFRHFASMHFTRGFQRFSDEYLRVDEDRGIRGFSNDSIRPDQRLILNYETVSFSPIYVYGFRFVFYGFTDIGFITRDKYFDPKNDIITEIGLGLRVRNNNLIFKTIDLRLSYFPFSPPYSYSKNFNISGEKLLSPYDFGPGAPGIIYYH